MKSSDWAERMNSLYAVQTPFLFILDFNIKSPIVLPLADVSASGIRFHINSIKNAKSFGPDRVHFLKEPIGFEIYKEGFEKVMQAIRAGDTYLLNLCYTTRIEGLPPLDTLFEIAQAPFKLLVPDRFVVFSPEPFVSIADGYIRTYPMKGTIDASIPDAESHLMSDVKEQEEHATVVDLLRNDLSMVSRKVKVERYRYISEIRTGGKTLLQCSSEISGVLEDDFKDNPGHIFQALLPAGSISGAPKKRTLELIKEIEPEPRGFFTGVFGVFDGTTLESAVMIRMIEQREGEYYYRSGGGITYRSVAELEYQEMIDKVYVPLG